MDWRIMALLGLGARAAVAVACGGDDDQVPVVYPTPGDGGTSSSTSSSSSSGGGSSSGSVTLSHDYCGALDAILDGIDRCCTDTDRQTGEYKLLFGFGKALIDKAVCPAIQSSVASGRMRVDKTAESTCVGAFEKVISELSCPLPSSFTGLNAPSPDVQQACKRIYVGTMAEGGGCLGDHECQDGLTCIGYTASSDGKCSQPPALDAACGDLQTDGGGGTVDLGFGNHPKCAPGGYCSGGKCVPQLQAGVRCFSDEECANDAKCYQGVCGGATGPSDVGGPCVTSTDCSSSTYCTASDAGTCEARKHTGESCAALNQECWGRCDVPEGGTTGTCATWCGYQ